MILPRQLLSTPICFALTLLTMAAATLFQPSQSHASPGFLCSAGGNDNHECDFDFDCPGGACLLTQYLCVGGSDDASGCDCPGSTCSGGTCAGGLFPGLECDTTNNCSGGTCQDTAQVCSGGDDEGFACANTGQCSNGGTCISNGLFCWGGPYFKFACIGDEDCGPISDQGTCVGPAPTVELAALCSVPSGPPDGQTCEDDVDCPGGACVYAQTVCDGGVRTDGFSCISATDCDPGSPCTSTPKVCSAGDGKGFGCLQSDSCDGGECVSTGKFCYSGDFVNYSCVDGDDCGGGSCITPAEIPACVGDCDMNCTVDIGDLQKGLNIFYGADPSECEAYLGTVDIGALQLGLNNFFGGCPPTCVPVQQASKAPPESR